MKRKGEVTHLPSGISGMKFSPLTHYLTVLWVSLGVGQQLEGASLSVSRRGAHPCSDLWKAALCSLRFSKEELSPKAREQRRVFLRNALGVTGMPRPWAKDKARPTLEHVLFNLNLN